MIRINDITGQFVSVYKEIIARGLVKNKSEFATVMGTYSHVLAKIERRERDVSFDLVLRLINKFGVKPSYLFGDEKEGNNVFMVDDPIRAGFSLPTDAISNPKIHGFKIPGIHGQMWAFPIIGDSMRPNVLEGDIVICEKIEKLNEIKEGQAYVLITNDKMVVKRLRVKEEDSIIKIELISDNPEFEIDELELYENIDLKIFCIQKRITKGGLTIEL